MTGVVLVGIIVVLAVVLAVLLRSIDYEGLRAHPVGMVSIGGLAAAAGIGFVLGLGYGILSASRGPDPKWMWVGRGLIDGLVMACAATLYIGFVQRRQRGG